MYGTVAWMKVKPGQIDALMKTMDDFNTNRHPKGYVGEVMYRLDSNPDEVIMAVLFQDKASYVANAGDPEQDKEYRKMREHLVADPKWADGEVIHNFMMK